MGAGNLALLSSSLLFPNTTDGNSIQGEKQKAVWQEKETTFALRSCVTVSYHHVLVPGRQEGKS